MKTAGILDKNWNVLSGGNFLYVPGQKPVLPLPLLIYIGSEEDFIPLKLAKKISGACALLALTAPCRTGGSLKSIGYIPEQIDSAAILVKKVVNDNSLDALRIYVTGAGEAASFLWSLISRYARLFAAAVPIGGTGDPYFVRYCKYLPLFVYYQSKGYTEDLHNKHFFGEYPAKDLIRALINKGAEDITSKELPDEESITAERLFRKDSELIKWLFSKNKAEEYEIHWIKPNLWNIESASIESFFLVEGKQKALLIDTGKGSGKIMPIIRNLTSLSVDLAITHAHPDHMLHVDEFENVYISQPEYNNMKKFFALFSFNPDVSRCHFLTTKDRDIISLGEHDIEVFNAFGHTPGSIVFADHKLKALFTGDAFGSGMGVLMALPMAGKLLELHKSIIDFLDKAAHLENYAIYGGHLIQERGENQTGIFYNPLCFDLIRDLAELCEKLIRGDDDLSFTIGKNKRVEGPVKYIVYKRAAMWFQDALNL